MFRKIGARPVEARSAKITIDGVGVLAEEGEPLAAILLRTGPGIARHTPVTGAPRAPYCMMGACFDCLVELDGAPSTRSCMVQVRSGMVVRRQTDRPDPSRVLG